MTHRKPPQQTSLIAWNMPKLLLLPMFLAFIGPVEGCGGDDSSPGNSPTTDAAVDVVSEANAPDAASDGDVDTGSDVKADVEEDAETDAQGDADTDAEPDADSDAQPPSFAVVSTTPTDQAGNVPVDSKVRIIFTGDIAPSTPLSAFWLNDSGGGVPNGKWAFQDEAAVFTPAMLKSNESYTVVVSTLVGDGTASLAQEYSFEFTTNDSTSSGKKPPGLEDAPLGPGYATFAKRPEYAIVWGKEKSTTLANTYVQGAGDFVMADPLADPSVGSAAELLHNSTALTQGADKIPVAGQFDDDPWDEVMVPELLGGQLTLKLLDATAPNTIESVSVPVSFAFSSAPPKVFSAVAADFDHDGRDELFVALASLSVIRVYWRLVDYNPATSAYEVVAQGELPASLGVTGPLYDVRIQAAAGDIDADGIPEPVMAWSGEDGLDAVLGLRMFDDLTTGLAPIGNPRKLLTVPSDPASRCPRAVLSMTTADVDGDGADEVLVGSTGFNYLTSSFAGHQCRTVDKLYYMDNFTVGQVVAQPLQGGGPTETNELGDGWYPNEWMADDRSMHRPMGLLVAGRFTGDPIRKEVLFHNRVYRFNTQGSVSDNALTVTSGWPVAVPTSIFDYLPAFPNYRMKDLVLDYLTRDAKVADMDGDGHEDVVLLRSSSPEAEGDNQDAGFKVVYFDLEVPAGGTTPSFDVHTEALAGGATYKGIQGSPRLALVNVDEDSPILELETHQAVLSDDILVAVLAVPPWKDGIGQNVEAVVNTEFAEGTGVSYTNSATASAKLGATLGLSWEPSVTVSALVVGIKITLAKVEAEFNAGVELGYEHEWGTSFDESLTYNTGSEENLIIVDNYVYESYQYKIIYHPDPAMVGEHISVNVPLGRRRYALSQTYYNEHNGNAMDIDAAILSAVPGDISSYPTPNAAQLILAAAGNETIIDPSVQTYLLEPPASSSASVTWGYGITDSDTNAFSVGLYVEASVKACTPDVAGWTPSVCGGIEGGATTGYAYSHTFSKTLSFAGTVGSIPSAEWFNNVYQTGMFAYRMTVDPDPDAEPAGPGLPVPGKQQFIVVNYYVQ